MSSTSRAVRTWRPGDPWTVTDATELYDVERWKYRDGREQPYGPMTREQIEIWTAAIDNR